MCNFCESLTNKNKEIVWSVRSTYADDNISELIREENNVIGEVTEYGITGYLHKGNTMVGISYRQEFRIDDKEDIIISPFSETIQFNFCPICGKQLSDEIKKFEDYYDHIISIEEK